MQKSQEKPKDIFREKINTIIRDIRNDYMEFLRCLKFYNKAEQDQYGVHRRGRHRNVLDLARQASEREYDMPLNDPHQYNYQLELSKENKMEIALLKVLEGVGRLQDLNAQLREYALINLEHDIEVQSVTESITKMLDLRKRATRPQAN